jgi:hypothetical protein
VDSWLQAATELAQAVSATTGSMASTRVGAPFCAWSCSGHRTTDEPPSVPPDETGELDGDLLNSFFLAMASDRPTAAADMPWGKAAALGTRKASSSSASSPSPDPRRDERGGRGCGSPSWEAGWARSTARWMG